MALAPANWGDRDSALSADGGITMGNLDYRSEKAATLLAEES